MANKALIIKLYIVSTVVLVSLDFAYLYLQQRWYKKEIKKIQRTALQLNWMGVLLRYVAQIIGLNIFILQQRRSILHAFIFGIVIYLNYLGTNYATIVNFNESLAVADLIKGGIIMSLTTFITYKLA